MWIILAVIAFLILGVVVFLYNPSFGRLPRGERLERITNSPNYRNGMFRNQSPTLQLSSDKSFFRNMVDFMFRNVENLRPSADLPVVETSLKNLDPRRNVLVWMGHGSYFIQTDGIKLLVDPVFYSASPVPFFNRAFKGTGRFSTDDMPGLDYIIITHDHWDHLDRRTIRELTERTDNIICPLGVGEHLEYWGYPAGNIIEMDWYEGSATDDGLRVTCLPARHFSGRGLKPNQTLWASWMLETGTRRIYLGGDGGYDSHFADIGERFGKIDLAVMENGQYDQGWKYIHLMPEDLVRAVKDLSPERFLTVHNSKYALAKHPWYTPLDNIADAAARDSLPLLTPMIGQPVDLDETDQTFERWWDDFK